MRKGVCKNGHKLTGDNAIIRKRPHGEERQCRICTKQYKRKWRQENKQHVKEYHDNWREKNRERVNEYSRFKGDQRRRAKGVPVNEAQRASRQKRPNEPRWHMLLAAEPFANWINAYMEREGTGHKETSLQLGPSPRLILALQKGERANVGLDIVDQAFINAGEHGALEAIYPLDALKKAEHTGAIHGIREYDRGCRCPVCKHAKKDSLRKRAEWRRKRRAKERAGA